MEYYTSDTFTRDGNLNGSSTDGRGTVDPLTWTARAGAWNTVASSQLATINAASGSPQIATVTPGISDVDIITFANLNGQFGGICFRFTDVSNYLYAVTDRSDNTTKLFKRVAGTNTQIGSSFAGAVNHVFLRVIAIGSLITVMRGPASPKQLPDTVCVTATDSFNSTATIHGIYVLDGTGGTSFQSQNFPAFIIGEYPIPITVLSQTKPYVPPPVKSYVYLNRQQQIPELEQSIFYKSNELLRAPAILKPAVRRPEQVVPPADTSNDGRNTGVMTAATIQIQTVNPVVINPIGEFDLNAVIQLPTPTFVERIINCATNTSIAVPTGATTVTITPPSTNTSALTLKGASGDSGVVLNGTQPTQLTLDSSQTTFIINASSAVMITFTFM